MRIDWKPRFSIHFRWMYVYSLLISFAVISFSITNPTLRSLLNPIGRSLFARFTETAQDDAQSGSNPEQVELSGHESWIYAVAITPDSHTLISGGFDKSLKFWNLSRVVKTFKAAPTEEQPADISQYAFEGSIRDAHSTAVSAIAVNRQRPLFATAGWDNRIKIWNLKSKNVIHTIENAHNDDIESIGFTPDGRYLVSAGLDKVAHLWDVETGKLVRTFSSSTSIHSLAISPDSRLLAAGNGSGQVLIWNLSTGDLLTPLAAHQQSTVSALAFSPDGKLMVSGGADKTIKLWQTDGNILQEELSVGTVPTSVTFSPDQQVIACAGKDGRVEVWRIWDGRLLQTLINYRRAMWTIAFSPDGQALLAGGQDKVIRVWSMQHGNDD